MLRFVLLVALIIAVVAQKTRTYDQILADKDISSLLTDYQVEEDDPTLRNFLLGVNNTMANTTTGNKANGRKGVKARHDVRDRQGFYKIIGAHKQGKIDDADFYIDKDAALIADKGVDVQEEKNYNRGSKTRGYHRIHHKDEYKKDQLIYDDTNSKGTLRRFGGKVAAYGTGVGGNIHKGKVQHDLQNGVFGKQGYFDKGSFENELEGMVDTQGFDGAFLSQAADAMDSDSDVSSNM